eukprot:TRINITY_DN8405_c0_g1_i3.p1 TRINITY_DN8405_c0_g1~~TRINITY_DN8405_c0_g1_i3.p1  ORF type:complete len:113 (-),score=1.94 TRINITY_DN8405_c0_g1_i3:73-411(-)
MNRLVTEAVWTISNALKTGSKEQIESIVELGCIPALCRTLDIDKQPMKLVQVILEALGNLKLMNDTWGQQIRMLTVDTLERVQSDPNYTSLTDHLYFLAEPLDECDWIDVSL